MRGSCPLGKGSLEGHRAWKKRGLGRRTDRRGRAAAEIRYLSAVEAELLSAGARGPPLCQLEISTKAQCRPLACAQSTQFH